MTDRRNSERDRRRRPDDRRRSDEYRRQESRRQYDSQSRPEGRRQNPERRRPEERMSAEERRRREEIRRRNERRRSEDRRSYEERSAVRREPEDYGERRRPSKKEVRRQKEELRRKRKRKRIILLVSELVILAVLCVVAYGVMKLDKIDYTKLDKGKLEVYRDTGPYTNIALFGASCFCEKPLLLYRRHGENQSDMKHYGIFKMIRNRIVFVTCFVARMIREKICGRKRGKHKGV